MIINDKHYTVNIKDFAAEQGVNVRTVQRKLVAEKYKKHLEGEFYRPNGESTLLTEKACEFLRGTFKGALVGVVTDAAREAEIARLKKENKELEKAFSDFVASTAAVLIEASNQKALAAASEDNRKKAEELQTRLTASEATNAKLQNELEAERERSLTLSERFFGRKKPKN